jgi:hypothetical protein
MAMWILSRLDLWRCGRPPARDIKRHRVEWLDLCCLDQALRE